MKAQDVRKGDEFKQDNGGYTVAADAVIADNPRRFHDPAEPQNLVRVKVRFADGGYDYRWFDVDQDVPITRPGRYRDWADRADLVICGDCSTRTVVALCNRDEIPDHDAWHDAMNLIADPDAGDVKVRKAAETVWDEIYGHPYGNKRNKR